MAIARQGDSIWAMGAMGYGHQHSPARDEDHYGVGAAARDHGESMGRKHADESVREYHRDEKGRFAPMPHHEHEKDDALTKLKSREHRDTFNESYHKGFTSRVKEHEAREKEKANKTSAVIVREAVKFDPNTGHIEMEDPGRFHYRLKHGGSDEGYVPPSWLDQILGSTESPDYDQWQSGHPSEKNPYRPDLDTLANMSNDKRFGLNLGMSNKAPFSRNDVGLAEGNPKLKANREYATLAPGMLASRPIQVTDHLGNTHTFVHQITAPNLNPDEDNPKAPGKWVVSLHHHVSRPDGTAEWLPSEVSHHVGAQSGVGGKISDELIRDIHGQLHANSDMVSLYGAGAQRVGDKHNSIEYEFRHPSGDVLYRMKLANGHNKWDGYYYDPGLPEKHPEALKGGAQWVVTGHGLERENPFDVHSPTRLVQLEGPEFFPKEDLPGVIDRVWSGLGNKDRPNYTRMIQNQMLNSKGQPPTQMIRGHASVRPWEPSYNIHRSRERLPIQWS